MNHLRTTKICGVIRNHWFFASPLGDLRLLAEDGKLVGLYLPGQACSVEGSVADEDVFVTPIRFLKAYFSQSEQPSSLPAFHLRGTPFQLRVWERLLEIPWGATSTYGQIANAIGSPNAARAVGKAISDNPISLIVPCHRVIGRTGLLTGYAGGLDAKRWLLNHEGVFTAKDRLQI